SRFDDVVHFSLRPPSLGPPRQEWKQNPHPRCRFLVGPFVASLRRLAAVKSPQVAVRDAQPTIPCACSIERAPACLNQLIQALIDRPTRSAQLFRCQSRERRDRMIRTRPSVSEISASLRPVIYFRSPAV